MFFWKLAPILLTRPLPPGDYEIRGDSDPCFKGLISGSLVAVLKGIAAPSTLAGVKGVRGGIPSAIACF